MANKVSIVNKSGTPLFDLPPDYSPSAGEKLTYDNKTYVVTADPPETNVVNTPVGLQVFKKYTVEDDGEKVVDKTGKNGGRRVVAE